jgi:hypothetical protein
MMTGTGSPDDGHDRPVWERVHEQTQHGGYERSPAAVWSGRAKGMASKATMRDDQPVGAPRFEAGRAVEQAEGDRPLMSVTSHDVGKNAVVTLYVDRIERVKERSALSLSRADREAEVIPLSSVSHVKTEKSGIRSNVIVTVADERITFRVSHREAKTLRDAIVRGMRS